MDLNGAMVHQEDHTFTSGIHKIDLGQWDNGMYIFEVSTDQSSEHIKALKK
jgi:endogenous inhibitor of DNA gyrase (YacG/DUF329 family)